MLRSPRRLPKTIVFYYTKAKDDSVQDVSTFGSREVNQEMFKTADKERNKKHEKEIKGSQLSSPAACRQNADKSKAPWLFDLKKDAKNRNLK